VTDREAGAHCQIKLDSGESIMVSQDRTGFAVGIVTIQEIRLSGLAPGAVLFRFDLEGETGQRLLARLVQGAPNQVPGERPRSVRPVPEPLPVPGRGAHEVRGPGAIAFSPGSVVRS
jgi:hypothetical protein